MITFNLQLFYEYMLLYILYFTLYYFLKKKLFEFYRVENLIKFFFFFFKELLSPPKQLSESCFKRLFHRFLVDSDRNRVIFIWVVGGGSGPDPYPHCTPPPRLGTGLTRYGYDLFRKGTGLMWYGYGLFRKGTGLMWYGYGLLLFYPFS